MNIPIPEAAPLPAVHEPSPPTEVDIKRAEELMGGLNDKQAEAARTIDGPVMIVAGPGSGKTRTLTHRIAYLLATKKAWPSQILALTFTNKAAREMRDRVEKLVGGADAKGLWMGTFHSVFARLLRREAEKIGFTRDYTIYDTDDTERMIKLLMERYNVDPKRYTPRSMRGRISGAKNQMVTPDEYLSLANDPFEEVAAKLYGPYNEALRRANAMDFDDLLAWPIRLFEQHPDVLNTYQHRWQYLHIDEYQDTNRAQYLLAKMLAAKHENLCVVGDDAQSIYAFRGADIGNILSFQKDYPQAKTVHLEQNYRSTGRILQLADSIIKNNRDQIEKSLWTKNPEGDHILLMEALSERDEAQKIERKIRDLFVRSGHRYSDFAVLYRTNAQSRSMEEALRRGGIPYRIVGGTSFYQRKEIKDALAYLRLVVNPHDDASLMRAINTPTRGIGAKTMEQLRAYANAHNAPLWDAARHAEEAGLSGRAAKAVGGFAEMILEHTNQSRDLPADEASRNLIQASGLLQSLRDENTPEALVRLENIHELLNAVAEFVEGGEGRTLSTFLQEVSLVADIDSLEEDDNRVTLMTLHASKGLEFKVVFVSGLEDGLFPLAAAAQDPKELEEERRLFYVGATRAEESLFLSFARTRYRFGEQQSSVRSRFLDEVDVEDVIMTESGRAFQSKKGRFTMDGRGDGSGRSTRYGGMDPHYYRQSLSGESKKPARQHDAGRRVVYDEGILPIVPGIEVEHATFGVGKVIAMEGQGDRTTATVFFPDIGQKKLKLKFARLQVVG
ncbi:MAG: UvrD-helicase domain-containing protein [Bacteroidetes bacterium]|nr:UvrD-helicase domain-containing protein [Bacteroidota bacterium]